MRVQRGNFSESDARAQWDEPIFGSMNDVDWTPHILDLLIGTDFEAKDNRDGQKG